MQLIVGLGNPGKTYEKTRHNIGFMMLDSFANSLNITFDKKKFDGIYTKTKIGEEEIILLKPQKYMNLSGEVVSSFMNFFKIPTENILIISDDLDMPTGKIKLKAKGSSGGHNGLKNIEMHLKTPNYKRLKIGISNNKTFDTKDYVLWTFSTEELQKIQEVEEKIPDIIKDYLTLSFDQLMTKYNRK